MRTSGAIILLLMSSPVLADHVDASRAADAPAAAEVLADLYRFDRSQQHLLESADLHGNQAVRNIAALRAEDAVKRDKRLKEIQREIGVEPHVGKTPLSEPYAETSDPEGPAYLRRFYAAQVVQYKTVVSSIERYLRTPDHDGLRLFAREQLPILRSQLNAAERTMTMTDR
jgi:hypothetical protein